MSIIERAADLLGLNTKPNQTPAAPGREGGIRDLDLIERAVTTGNKRLENSESGEPIEQSEGRGLAAESKGKSGRALPASATSQTFRIDFDRLRRQSMITPDGERSPISEEFQHIKRQILENMANPKSSRAPANLVMVTSALKGEGKTFCAINLALSMAMERDRTVLLVDADVANPSVPKALGVNAEKGLMDLLLDNRMDPSELLCKINIGKLTLLPAGTAQQHPTELLASDAMRTLLHELSERYNDRLVIFDSPPLLAASEASVLASQMGQIVIVVEAGKTSEGVLKDALGRVEASKVAGLVLNKGEGPGLGNLYGGYGYGGPG